MYSDTAEVVVFFDPLDVTVESDDISRAILHCKFLTAIAYRAILTTGCSGTRYGGELPTEWAYCDPAVGKM